MSYPYQPGLMKTIQHQQSSNCRGYCIWLIHARAYQPWTRALIAVAIAYPRRGQSLIVTPSNRVTATDGVTTLICIDLNSHGWYASSNAESSATNPRCDPLRNGDPPASTGARLDHWDLGSPCLHESDPPRRAGSRRQHSKPDHHPPTRRRIGNQRRRDRPRSRGDAARSGTRPARSEEGRHDTAAAGERRRCRRFMMHMPTNSRAIDRRGEHGHPFANRFLHPSIRSRGSGRARYRSRTRAGLRCRWPPPFLRSVIRLRLRADGRRDAILRPAPRMTNASQLETVALPSSGT